MTGSTAGAPPGQKAPETVIVADDLTGAADTAVAFAGAGMATRVVFAGRGTPQPAASERWSRVVALDTDSRRLGPDEAAQAVAAALAGIPVGRLRMKKVDSTLRGSIGAETQAALDALGCRLALCAPAFPAADRQTLDGVQWAAGSAVGEVAACFTGMATAHLPLAAVRDGSAAESLAKAAAAGARVVVLDAATDQDLDDIVTAGGHIDEVLWVGSGGLGAALARAASSYRPSEASMGSPAGGPALAVVGSGTEVAAAQADALVEHGAVTVSVPAGALIAGTGSDAPWPGQVTAGLAAGRDVLVRIGDGDQIRPGHGRQVVEELARLMAPSLRDTLPAVLLATGGETALAFAHALGADGLEIRAELEPGVVCSALTGATRLPVITKAGAFGDPGTLLRALGILRNQTTRAVEGLR